MASKLPLFLQLDPLLLQLDCLLKAARVKPALDYYCLHPGMGPDAHGLRSYAAKRGVKTFAYGAIGEPGPVRAPRPGRAGERFRDGVAPRRRRKFWRTTRCEK